MEPIKIFYCYASQDRKLRDVLEKHLMSLKRLGQITLRLNREIEAGTNWSHVEDQRFQAADLILLLISPDFICSDYHYGIEMHHALEKHEAGNVWVIPIILRPTALWEKTPIGKLQALPKDGKAITERKNRETAFVDIVKEIGEAVAILLTQKQEQTLPKFTQVIGPPCITCGARNQLGVITCENCGDLLLEKTEVFTPSPQEKTTRSAEPKYSLNSGMLAKGALAHESIPVHSHERFCENCGAANVPMARFCHYCAVPLPFPLPTSLPKGTVLNDHYQVEERIGQGSMTTVYKASDRGRFVAIKEMSHDGLSSADIREEKDSLQRAVEMLAGLTHPNLPRIYDQFTEGERSYLVMDFIDGETLEAHLNRLSDKRLPIERVFDITRQLCEVLDYLHTRQPPIVFRDLKPSNVMMGRNGHIILDFSIARFFKPRQSHDTVALGSLEYAAPEQYGKAQSTSRSDIYSLGVLLHYLLTGIDPSMHPFIFRPASQLNPLVSPELEALLQRMLSMDADLRPVHTWEIIPFLDQRFQSGKGRNLSAK